MELLIYLKKIAIGFYFSTKKNCSRFRIRNPEILRTFILPLLQNQLLTVSKPWDFFGNVKRQKSNGSWVWLYSEF
jgi:hypothetical protein